MKNGILKSASTLFVMILFLTACNAQKYGKVKGSGNVINKTRNVGSFEQIGVSGSFDVTLKKGDEGRIDIKIEDNLLPYLITEVSNGKLKIKWKNGTNISTNKGVYVTVYYQSINAVGLSGSGDVISKDVIKSDNFEVSVSGSGDIELEVDTNHLHASVSGSGDVDLSGTTNEFDASVVGSGDIDAYGLISDKASLKISGSGGMNLTVKKELEARVSGSGDIKYKGNPKIEDIKVSGSGNVRSY